ncbi:MAG: sorbitol-6-phosphate dehydrogenase subunit [Sodalis sp. (in: enterobacteria)]|uniref:sorbitol-6-phosphate dehydrogenase subunit n=1 Tax=Sodalis sp. (in: enterobacteria) TaxID=1898979 RepID=UPI003F2E7C72
MALNKWINLNQRVVIVTGGSSGIGAHIVSDLLENNAQVIVADIQLPDAASHATGVDYRLCNIIDRTSFKKFVDDIYRQHQRINGLVNNARVNRARSLVDYYSETPQYQLSDDDFDFIMRVNQKRPFIFTQEVARVMIRQKQGAVVNIFSEAGIEGSKRRSCYSATKAAVHSFTLSWAKELGAFGIRVVGVAPGINEPTPMWDAKHREALAYTRGMKATNIDEDYSQKIPLGRQGKLDEITNLVTWLLFNKSSYITGTTINITGGGKSRG